MHGDAEHDGHGHAVGDGAPRNPTTTSSPVPVPIARNKLAGRLAANDGPYRHAQRNARATHRRARPGQQRKAVGGPLGYG